MECPPDPSRITHWLVLQPTRVLRPARVPMVSLALPNPQAFQGTRFDTRRDPRGYRRHGQGTKALDQPETRSSR